MKKVKRWEYKFVETKFPSAYKDSEKEFEILGKEGWELTFIITIYLHPIAIFKRELE